MGKDCSVTPYRGYESAILALRNATRSEKRDRSYLDWRYLGLQCGKEPEIFWLHVDGQPVGMVGGIYRSYLVEGNHSLFLVLGDISLLPPFRGTGLIDDLFGFVRDQIEEKQIPCSLVLPNIPAMKVLARNGWHKAEDLIHHVLYLRPWARIRSLVPWRPLVHPLSWLYQAWVWWHQARISSSGYILKTSNIIGDDLDQVWNRIDKQDLCIKEMSLPFLRWRYTDHPREATDFVICRCYRDTTLAGFLVYRLQTSESVCSVYDILAIDPPAYLALLKLMVNWLKRETSISSIRLVLNEHHPVAPLLRQVGFSARREETLFQILVPGNGPLPVPSSCTWAITSGDKDV